ncbi:MAG TPA: 4-(cytidine 5'-diphospho)-2-C-methyl-D-erythritol kinase [Leptospiraceae bacterium]|nr:4-(cytidine 5'-diphospho)-2-C-methyl-D-erythritol kinase [Leptospiraceae bacterium]HMW07724.1 4-(cytidine 5'-diphospho)-2-C-methyl-D-erythritol kinase [Leptospiraceae bacterium]HMY33390.1 4-(cytidine 5'-diphospho)-2-C-methyl-D-erythritol kinase [Leptospiraceae bacterium]HMZ64802.1 4-(cytidine 5'-diphospho)-2-C-methyl-D-erythritol kinase [Leptospiraceae bacterium]HNA08661.1 4-(cytidine 5'-diphospho)-2-C-methyl-D-erythritol kinase [Leptospiraceae bacterium]
MLSPAKINLGLKILYKRPDQYHELESVFLKLNWGDDIEFVENDSGKIRLVSQNELSGIKYNLFEEVSERGDFTKNILFKTFEKVKTHLDSNLGIDVHLTKRIPPGGGVGGGSSNAASLLTFLATKLSNEKRNLIMDFAPKIGADIPFFLRPGHFLVSGIGEVLKPIQVASGFGILAIPPFSISTKESYLSLKKPLQTDWVQKSWNLLDEASTVALAQGDWAKLQDRFENDFERYAFSEFSELEMLKQSLYKSGCSYVSMTGTGSCVYGFVQDRDHGTDILKKMTQNYPKHYFIQFSF